MAGKDEQFYAAAVSAWFSTRMEHDRSLLALSAGAIGLLVTLVSTVGVRSCAGVILYSGALGAFLVCVGCVLLILKKNATYLENVALERKDDDPALRRLDRLAIGSFFIGAVLSAAIGATTAAQSIKQSEIVMPENDKPHVRPMQEDSKKSFEGAGKLRPKPAETPTKPPSMPSDSQPATPAKPDGK